MNSRNENVVLLRVQPISRRAFDGWAMAYIEHLDATAFRIPDGFLSDVVSSDREAAAEALDMMKYFITSGDPPAKT